MTGSLVILALLGASTSALQIGEPAALRVAPNRAHASSIFNQDGPATDEAEPDADAERAATLYKQGNEARQRNEAAKALELYQQAAELDPAHGETRYEAARTLAFLDRPDEAIQWLQAAADAGFWALQEMNRDPFIKKIKKDPAFRAIAQKVRRQYNEERDRRMGRHEVHEPEGDAPAGGWPVLVCLHGYGSNYRSFASLARLATLHGMVGISVAGPEILAEGRDSWPGSGETTHELIQSVLSGYRDREDLDFSRVYLAGFSQGAMHATYMAALKPDDYRGVMPISPGGRLFWPAGFSDHSRARPVYLVYGTAENQAVRQLAATIRDMAQEAGFPFREITHGGGHHFPDDWEKVLGEGLEFLMAGE